MRKKNKAKKVKDIDDINKGCFFKDFRIIIEEIIVAETDDIVSSRTDINNSLK